MTTEKLTSSDKRLIVFVLLAAAASIVFVRFNYFAAFPQASINLRHSKAQITRIAEEFLKQRGLAPSGFRNVTLFDPDESARIYLERETDLEEANRLMQGPVSVWRWRARWFQPPHQEERIVWLSPAGDLVGFEHILPEAAPGARLEMNRARDIAEAFLRSRTTTPEKLVEERLEERPNRHDFVFTWEQEGFRVREASYRRTVVIQGDRVGRYAEYLHVPEKWKRDFAKLRSQNELYSQIAQLFWFALGLAAVAALIRSFRRRLIRWRPLLLIAGAVAILTVINEWNALPFYIDRMPTSSPYPQSVLFGLLSGIGSGAGVFFLVILAAAAGEPLYRSRHAEKLSLLALPLARSVRTREFFVATIVGYGFAAAHIAFVVAFYLLGRRFGVWSPQDVSYSDLLSTALPWIYPVAISLLASTSEEFWFRLFAIHMLRQRPRLTWLAVVVPAFIWGFLHANYPQQPPYIRGIEVGVIGVAAGFLMLRFGILATLIWHYAVDAVLIGTFLIQADSWYFQLSGWLAGLAVLFPLILSLVFYRKHGGFLADPALLNSGVVRPPEGVPAPSRPAPAEPLAPRWPRKWLYGAAAAAGAAGLLFHPQPFGDFIRVRITRPEAAAIAAREFATLVRSPGSWRSATEFRRNLSVEEFEYVRRLEGRDTANRLVERHIHAGFWRTRFFQPLSKEEWHVYVSQSGSVFRTDRILGEDAPEAQLTPDEARQVALDYLLHSQNLAVERWRLVDSSSTKRDRRVDHHFVWEDPGFRVGEARARVSVDVVGDRPSGFQAFLKLPEQWTREFHKPRLSGMMLPAAAGALSLLLLIAFVRALGAERRYHWKTYSTVAATGAVLSVLAALNEWPSFLAGYRTEVPLESFITDLILRHVMGFAVTGLGLFLAVLAADVFLQSAFGDRRPHRPSLLRAAAIFTLAWGLNRVLSAVGLSLPGPRVTLPLWELPGAGSLWPAAGVLASSVITAAFTVCLLAVAVAAAVQRLTPSRRLAAVGAAAAVFAASRALHPAQFAFYFGAVFVAAGVIVLVARTCGTDLITFGIAVFWLRVSGPAAVFIEQPAPFFRWNGVACFALAALFGAAAVALLRHRGSLGGGILTGPREP